MSDTARTKAGFAVLLSAVLTLMLAACSRVITHEPSADRYDSVTEQNASYQIVQAPQDRPAYGGSYYAKARFDGTPNPTGESFASGNQNIRAPDGYEGVGNGAFRLDEGCWNWLVVHQRLSITAGKAVNEVTLNGQKVTGSTNSNNYSRQGADQVRFGMPYVDQDAQSAPLEFDVDDAYVGATNDAPPTPRSNSCVATDHSPPKFAGLKSATTCIPGPIGGGRTSSYHLGWDPATDDVTPPGEIVYEIYQATAPGGQDFGTPTYSTHAGATSFDTPPLPSDQSFYFVVRARDEAGNRDSNIVEREGVNLCD